MFVLDGMTSFDELDNKCSRVSFVFRPDQQNSFHNELSNTSPKSPFDYAAVNIIRAVMIPVLLTSPTLVQTAIVFGTLFYSLSNTFFFNFFHFVRNAFQSYQSTGSMFRAEFYFTFHRKPNLSV